jgi:hypothetical protein
MKTWKAEHVAIVQGGQRKQNKKSYSSRYFRDTSSGQRIPTLNWQSRSTIWSTDWRYLHREMESATRRYIWKTTSIDLLHMPILSQSSPQSGELKDIEIKARKLRTELYKTKDNKLRS